MNGGVAVHISGAYDDETLANAYDVVRVDVEP